MSNIQNWITALRCPTPNDLLAVVAALLPRGRAWQNHESGPDPGLYQAFQKNAFQNDAFAVDSRPPSVLYQYWAAVAQFANFIIQRLCALRLEFWCATHSETHDLWMEEYGLPDPCDAFPDLCAKVAAIGGTRCEYFADVAARAGWSIECIDQTISCGARAGCARAGTARSGRRTSASLIIRVRTGESPSFQGPKQRAPRAGRFRARQHFACGPNIAPLRCILERIVPAHVEIQYLTS